MEEKKLNLKEKIIQRLEIRSKLKMEVWVSLPHAGRQIIKIK